MIEEPLAFEGRVVKPGLFFEGGLGEKGVHRVEHVVGLGLVLSMVVLAVHELIVGSSSQTFAPSRADRGAPASQCRRRDAG